MSTNPTDNQTPQPVDEIEDIIVKLHGTHGVAHEMIAGKSTGFVYCPHCKEAKARLLQWGTRQRLIELEDLLCPIECHYGDSCKIEHTRIKKSYIKDRITDLQASLKDGGNDA